MSGKNLGFESIISHTKKRKKEYENCRGKKYLTVTCL
jgi:hypothetical protein